jgi:hypothetical protein
MKYITRKSNKTISCQLEEDIKTEAKYWKNVLERVVAVICTIVERNLAFRGSLEVFGSEKNGNFMGILELIAKFDPFLSQHIEKYGNRGSGNTSYLSKITLEELLVLMSSKVLESIVTEIKMSPYFGLSVDSTPDISHNDQLCVIFRYLPPNEFEPVERFAGFLAIEKHTGEYLADVTSQFISKRGIDISKCRGQSYDNAPNMSGRYIGMQQKILEQSKFARFIPCAAHSLDLAGCSGVDCCIECINFFSYTGQIYTFFSGSSKRWAVLQKYCDKTPKKLSETRWNTHAHSVKQYSKIMIASSRH